MTAQEHLWEELRNEERRMQAFEKLVKLHYPQVKGWVRRWVGDEAMAEDIVQETFLKAWENCHTFRGEAQFSSWLYTIARRLTLRTVRKRSIWRWIPWRWEAVETIESAMEPSEMSAESIETNLRAALKRLSPIQQAVWQAVWEENLPYKKVAQRLGIRENTVKAHIHQIRQRLRKWFGRE
ncbi:MAG: sigma-70 family RNA polymerase sigma factor [Bacteroidia bacterium]|nr:sigma-70 family RNA polymerase sigma factor [Bacteroidia bacterium]MCX7651668.1 sigma-70 family RNA polymerase sigma factor [Bacteroidia bacterium]MDW8417202.1 sigma-70 family RNA polymerase sigma factor [Bacteroidia bacterium]